MREQQREGLSGWESAWGEHGEPPGPDPAGAGAQSHGTEARMGAGRGVDECSSQEDFTQGRGRVRSGLTRGRSFWLHGGGAWREERQAAVCVTSSHSPSEPAKTSLRDSEPSAT